MNAIENLRAVLCDPEGNVCIHGSGADRQIIFDALAAIEQQGTRDEGLRMASKVCKRRAEERFEEHGTREHDTNATYYGGRMEEIYSSLDEEDDDCAAAIEALIGQSAPTLSEQCEWKADEEGNWSTDCGEVWCLIDGTPSENDMKFCHGCGHPLAEVPYQEPKEDGNG